MLSRVKMWYRTDRENSKESYQTRYFYLT